MPMPCSRHTEKSLIPQRLSTEPVNNQDRNRLGCATSILFPFHFSPLQVILFCPETDSEPTEAYENTSHCLPKASDQAPDEGEYTL